MPSSKSRTARLPLLTFLSAAAVAASAREGFRPPAVPLIAHDPYFSVWSFDDALNGGPTHHWTGAPQPLRSLVRIDGVTYRLMGATPESAAPMPQTGVRVGPTQTVYTFAGAGTEVTLTFTNPLLPNDLDVFSRPATYVTWTAKATDGKTHEVSAYFDAGAQLAVNVPTQNVEWSRTKVGDETVLSIGSEEQPVLAKRGDNLRIDWGHLYVVGMGKAYLGARGTAEFARSGSLPADERSKPTPAAGIVAAFAVPMGKVGGATVSKHVMVAYDDEYSIQFMGHNLRPYWRRSGMDAKGMLAAAERDYPTLMSKCAAFDRQVASDLTRIGGAGYAKIAGLAYPQSFAAQKLCADANGQPLMFSKENFSNGCISTVDVLYPAAPQLIFFSPTLTKASLVPIMEYAASSRWKWPFAPHDLGQYPKANGQVYGGGERTEENQMPVEETGNLLIVLAALAKEEGNARFSAKYWPQLQKWAAYLADKGFDPESQLSTDDFAGHLAHNVNLSAKAIEALGAYASLAAMQGKTAEATKYRALAKSFADRWIREGLEGDHYKLAFDKTNTWSQKYNLVWDRLLGLNLFPASVAKTEMAYYRTKLNAYGLPLDSREDYTKLDWITWTATLTPSRSDFLAMVDPVVKFLDETTSRVPMTDWYWTSKPEQRGFQARSVVGGVFIKALDDPATWSRYAKMSDRPAGPWAALPTPPVMTEVVPTAMTAKSEWRYTFEQPPAGWTAGGYDASAWKRGIGGFGHGDNRGGKIGTNWDTKDIWIRRDFDLRPTEIADVQLYMPHDDGAEVYVNGLLVANLPGATGYETISLPKSVRASLKRGKNTIAIHCHDDGGDSYIDAGFVTVRMAP